MDNNKLKTTDLRIGNFVITPRGVEKIVEIHRNHLMFEPLRESPYVTYSIDLVKPIPLTEEWLVKFGIKDLWIKGSWKIVEDKMNGEHYGWGMLVRNSSRTKEIEFAYFKYVHELQNLFYAVVGEELTIKKD